MLFMANNVANAFKGKLHAFIIENEVKQARETTQIVRSSWDLNQECFPESGNSRLQTIPKEIQNSQLSNKS